MRYLLISDLHANLPAAQAAVDLARKLGADEIIHLGDAVSIGPWPSETLAYLTENNVRLLKGNHEEYVYMDPPPETRMGANEIRHNDWLREQLGKDQIKLCRDIPYRHRIGSNIVLQHYALDEMGRISTKRLNLEEDNLLEAFGVGCSGTNMEKLIIFGHIHTPFFRRITNTSFISFGTSGCFMKNGSGRQALLIDVSDNGPVYKEHSLEWSTEPVKSELISRRVPARDEVIDIFFNEVS